MTFRLLTMTRTMLTVHRRRWPHLEMRCTADDCPAPTLCMNIGDQVVIKLSAGTQRHPRVFHPYCAIRKNISYA